MGVFIGTRISHDIFVQLKSFSQGEGHSCCFAPDEDEHSSLDLWINGSLNELAKQHGPPHTILAKCNTRIHGRAESPHELLSASASECSREFIYCAHERIQKQDNHIKKVHFHSSGYE